MAVSNAQIAELLRRYAAALSLEGANRFKLKAYRRAAETIEELDEEVVDLVEQGSDLTELPGIGKAINQVIIEIVQNGKLDRLDTTMAHLKPELVELAGRPSLDPEKVTRAYKKLGIGSLSELKASLDEGRIGKLLGSRLEYHVRQGLDERPRSLLYDAQGIGQKVERYLKSLPGVTCVSAAGSLRRKQETVGDLNFLFTSKSAAAVFNKFSFGGVLSREQKSPYEQAYRLSSGYTIVLRWTSSREWGFSQTMATGSALHLADLATRAGAINLELSAASLSAEDIDLGNEESVYAGLGLDFIEPELREGRGEVAVASRGKLPRRVTVDDLRGDLHMHTTASDGANSIAEMAEAAVARGYEYIAIADHSQSLRITNGLTESRLLQQIRNIDKFNSNQNSIRVLKAAEVDILEDGKLDYSNAVLKELDLTICSIHSRFGLNRTQQTERILRAMDNPQFKIMGHATGRLLLKRPGYELDMDRIIEHAKSVGCFFEINSSPDRLDLSDEHAKLARDAGIRIAINTDAHSTEELDFISAGINQARRGWLEPSDVMNTLPVDQLLKQMRR